MAGIGAVAMASGLFDGASQASRRVGVGDLTRIHAITDLYRSVDYECGGGNLYAEVGRFAETISAQLTSGSCADPLRPRLLVAAAEARQLAGWTAFDAGQNLDAQRHWLAAERAAVAADAQLLAARVCYCQARLFQHLHHNQDALDCLLLDRDRLGTGATPAVTAMLCGAQAASLAALGRRRDAELNLGAASDAFETIDPDREPSWMAFYDRGELLAQ